jgi:hypothetical protein
MPITKRHYQEPRQQRDIHLLENDTNPGEQGEERHIAKAETTSGDANGRYDDQDQFDAIELGSSKPVS